MKRLSTILSCFAVAMLCMASVTSAQLVHNSFWADMDTENNVIALSSEEFFEYPQPDGPTWSNAWFFNSPEIQGWKWIEYFMELRNTTGNQDVEVAINWSNDQWLDPTVPPLPPNAPGGVPNPDDFIVRKTIWDGPLEPGLNVLENPGEPIIIPDYNPIWVSFDIRALDGSTGELQMDVQLWHEHMPVPEPGTAMLLLTGLAGLLCFQRRKR